MNPLDNAAVFLIDAIGSLVILVFMLRFLLEFLGITQSNPLSVFIGKVTGPVVNPIGRFIPRYKGFNTACFVSIFLLQAVLIVLIALVAYSMFPKVGGLALWSLGEVFKLLVNVFFFSIIIMIIISWVNPHTYNPIVSVLHQLTEPLMAPARRLIPPIGGLDISPIPVILFLELSKIIIAHPMIVAGRTMALG